MTKPQENTPAAVLIKTAAELNEMIRLYQVAVSIQYERKKKGSSGPGTHSDPTASMATSVSGHKSVRNAVVLVDGEVERLYNQVQRLSNLLGDAIDRWDS